MLPQKMFKIRIFNLAENEFQTTKFPDFPWLLEFYSKFPDFLGKFPDFGGLFQIPWLFQVFQVSGNPGAGLRHPVRWIWLLNKTENACWPKLSQNSWKVVKLWKMLFVKLVSDYFSENPWWVFKQLSENFNINRKAWENDFGQISWK